MNTSAPGRWLPAAVVLAALFSAPLLVNDKQDDYFNEAIITHLVNEAVRGPLEDKFKAKNFELLKIKGGTSMATAANHRSYKNIMLFHFDPQGHLRAQYGVRRQENNRYSEQNPNTQRRYLASDGRSLYWMICEITGVREQSGIEGGAFKVLYYPAVAKIDLAVTKLSNFAKFGNEQCFLNNTTPQLPMGGKNSIVYFGENRSGKTMWFGQMPLE